MIGNEADEQGRRDISENMNNEEVYAHCRRTNLRRDRVYDGSIQWTGIQKEKELGYIQRGIHPRYRTIECEQRGRESQQHTGCREDVVSRRTPLKILITQPSSYQRGEKAIDDRDCS